MFELLQGFLLMLAALLAGVAAAMFIIPLVFPGLIHKLVIDPNKDRPAPVAGNPESADSPVHYDANKIGFFTYLEPGQVKLITRWGGSFIRAVMDHVGWKFAGESPVNTLEPKNQAYWEVEKTPDGERDSHPVPFPLFGKKGGERLRWFFYSPISVYWWAWKRYIYSLTGAVWVGIPGYRTLVIYRYDRSKQFTERYTDEQQRPATRENLKPTWDYSDHLRVANFPFGVLVPEADTQNMVPVRAMFNIMGRVKNPVITAFNSDNRWPTIYRTGAMDAISASIRHRPVNAVTAAAHRDSANDLAKEITERLKDDEVALLGIEVTQAQYIDVSTVDSEHAERLADAAIAAVDRDAAVLRAEGNAARLQKIGEAIKDHPHAETIMQTDASVQMATQMKDNPSAIVNIGGAAVDPIQAAILKELRQQRQGAPT